MTPRPSITHTPGPWHVNAIDSKRGRIVGDETADPKTWDKLQIHGGNCTVASVYRPRDARLIAEAPALLEALWDDIRGLESACQQTTDSAWAATLRGMVERNRAILARIEGSQS